KLASNGQPKLIVSTSPATGRKLGEVWAATPEDIKRIMETARLAQGPWERLGLRARLALMRGLRDAMYRNLDRIVDTVVAEQGRPRFEGMIEYWPTIELLSYYLKTARRTLAPEPVFVKLVPHRAHWVERRPHGVVLITAPCPFPLTLSLAPLFAALIAGNPRAKERIIGKFQGAMIKTTPCGRRSTQWARCGTSLTKTGSGASVRRAVFR